MYVFKNIKVCIKHTSCTWGFLMKVWESKPCNENMSSVVMVSQVIVNAMGLAPNVFSSTWDSKTAI